MRICIPVEEDRGLESPVCAHFGSAPLFMIVETGDRTCRTIENQGREHAHGMCRPLAMLGGEELEGVVVGGIGMGSLMKLKAAGIEVYSSDFDSVGETLDALAAGTLKTVTPGTACQHHGQGHGQGGGGCGHHH